MCVCVTVCVSVSRAQRVVLCCDLMSTDVGAVSRSSNVRYPGQIHSSTEVKHKN